MAKTNAERVRAAEQMHRDRGEKEIRIWVPNIEEAIRAVRKLAAKLCAKQHG